MNQHVLLLEVKARTDTLVNEVNIIWEKEQSLKMKLAESDSRAVRLEAENEELKIANQDIAQDLALIDGQLGLFDERDAQNQQKVSMTNPR